MKVTKLPPVPVPPTFSVDMTEDEASLLMKFCGLTCGAGKFGDLARKMFHTLDAAGVRRLGDSEVRMNDIQVTTK